MAVLVQSLAFVFMAQWFRLGSLRCSPLNAALGFLPISRTRKKSHICFFIVNVHDCILLGLL